MITLTHFVYGFFPVWPKLRDVTGSLNSCVMLSLAIHEEHNGWFDKSAEEWERLTALSYEQQVTSRKHLRDAGVWEEKHDRLNHKMFYRVNYDALAAKLKEAA